jgi:4-amino-4-deoxy-L-arabinose transferase-like glycosyltransferase
MRRLRSAQPLLALIVLVALLLAVTIIAREISARAGFLVERSMVLFVLLGGLLVASAVFAWVVRRAIRRADSTSSAVLLVATVLALASPLALMLLQHPSP